MKVLMITGDKKFGPGTPRYELQRRAVEELAVVYWGWGNLLPRIPRGNFDVVTAQDPLWRGLLAWFIARSKGARLNVQVHGDIEASKKYLAFVLRRADSVRVVSEKIKQQVERAGVRAPITVLPVYVDMTKFKSTPPKVHDGKNILWIGRFEPEKNPGAAVGVLKEVRAAGVDAKLILLGSGSMEARLKVMAKGLPVEFPGWQDPGPYLQTADVVLSTSWHESWGQSIVEALAAGVAVVAPDVGVASEAGAIVVPREKLAQAAMEVLQSGERGELKIKLLSADEWAQEWKKSL